MTTVSTLANEVTKHTMPLCYKIQQIVKYKSQSAKPLLTVQYVGAAKA